MRRKSKYPRRPWNDGDHYIQGWYHTKGRQSRGQPTKHVVHSDTPVDTNTRCMSHNHATEWQKLSPDTVIEMCVKGALTLTQVESYIKNGTFADRVEFRVEFLQAIKDAAIAGTVSDPVALFNKYRPALVGWN